MEQDKLPVTVTSLMYIGFSDMLDQLAKYYTEEVEKQPEGLDALNTLDEKLRRYTNYYSYLTELYNYAVHYTRSITGENSKEAKTLMMDKRDALERILKAVDVKIKTSSRMITVREIKVKEGHAQSVGQARNASNQDRSRW
jgi:hypothetical protein